MVLYDRRSHMEVCVKYFADLKTNKLYNSGNFERKKPTKNH